MIAAVIPVHNEEQRVGIVLQRLSTIRAVSSIIIVLNGSNKATQAEVEEAYRRNTSGVTVATFREPLGIDVPRAVGAKLAFMAGVSYTLFVDGDLVGEIAKELALFVETAVNHDMDLALMDCYPHLPEAETLENPLFVSRRLLNSELKLLDKIGIACPSHGPHMISRRMQSSVPWRDYAVPPTLLVHAVRNGLNIGVAGAIPHARLGSSLKNTIHNQLIVDTIIGDCMEALCMARHLERKRVYDGKVCLGYHGQRRFDLLDEFLAGRFMV